MPWPAAPGTEGNDAEHAPGLLAPALAGRARELSVLARSLAGAAAVVLVEGEAGIGKTRLVTEFLATPAGRVHRPLVAICPPLGQPCTLGPVADAIRQATDGVAGLGLSGLAGALRPLFPEWAFDLPPVPEPLEDASAARHRVFSALAGLLAALKVSLLVVEDVHWADEATVDFLLYLAARQPRPLTVVVSYRPEEVSAGSLLPRLARLAAGESGHRITLGPLNVAETAGLVASMLAGQQITAEFAAFLHERTEGVPLAVEELVRLMGDRADLACLDGAWVRRHLAEIAVPPTIRDAVLERAARLGADAQAVLWAAAVLTQPAPEAAVTAVTGLEAGRGRVSLAEALRCGLLAEDCRRLVSFRHALACQAVYEAIPGPARRMMHLRAGRALESLSPPPVPSLAQHFRAAGETGQWCRYAEQAADLALASGDDTTAATLLHELITTAGLPAYRVARLTKKMPLAAVSRDAHQGLSRALRSVLDGALHRDEEADVRAQLGRVLVMLNDFPAARRELEKAIPHLGHDPATAARAMIYLGWPRGTGCPASEHLRWLRRSTRVVPPAGAAERLNLMVARATGLLLQGHEAGWAEAARLPGGTPGPEERLQAMIGHLNVGDLARLWGRYAEARRQLARALSLAEAHEYRRVRDLVLVGLARLDWVTGNWNGLAETAGNLAEREDLQPLSRSEAILVTALLSLAAGTGSEAEKHLELVLRETRRHGAADISVEPAAALARLLLAAGRIDDALALTGEPSGIVASKGIWLWATDLAPARAGALIAANRAGDAEALVAAFARGLRGRNAPAPRAGLALCRAILAEAHGEHARAGALFARAAAAWQALPRPYDMLLARERQAHCLLAAGKADAGLGLLTEVLRGLSRLGATGDAGRVARALRGHGVRAHRPGAGRPSYGDRLSPRELAVVRLLVTGQTNAEIARKLFLSPRTVACHITSAMRKQKADSRAALAASAVAAGLAPAGRADAGAGQPAAAAAPN